MSKRVRVHNWKELIKMSLQALWIHSTSKWPTHPDELHYVKFRDKKSKEKKYSMWMCRQLFLNKIHWKLKNNFGTWLFQLVKIDVFRNTLWKLIITEISSCEKHRNILQVHHNFYLYVGSCGLVYFSLAHKHMWCSSSVSLNFLCCFFLCYWQKKQYSKYSKFIALSITPPPLLSGLFFFAVHFFPVSPRKQLYQKNVSSTPEGCAVVFQRNST